MIREIPQIPCPIPGALSLPDPELLPATLPANLRLTIQASPNGSNLSAEQNFLLRLERPHSSRRFVFFEHPKSEAKLQLLDGSDEIPSGGSQFVAKFRPKGGPGETKRIRMQILQAWLSQLNCFCCPNWRASAWTRRLAVFSTGRRARGHQNWAEATSRWPVRLYHNKFIDNILI
jgi:hypothetical protein